MPLDTNTLPDRNPHFGHNVIDWIDVQGRVAEYLIHMGRVDDPTPYDVEFAGVKHTVTPTVGSTTIKATSLKDFPIQTADQLLSQLADAPTVERQSGPMLEVEHEVKVQLVRAQSKIAKSTRRAMGNTLIPAANADGFWLTYVGTNAGDRAAMLLHDDQYVAVDNFRDYFVWVPGDPIEIKNAFDALYRNRHAQHRMIDSI